MTGRGLQRFRPAQPDGMQDEGYLELADLDASDYDSGQSGLWTRGLLIRRNLADGECAYFTTWCPAGTGIETLVAVEGQRWSIEDSFETSKNELGLDHNETRSWHGWHRHVSLVMLAFAMLTTIRYHANCQPPQKPPPSMIRKHNQPSSTGRHRKSAASPHDLRSGALSLPMSLLGRSGGAPIRPQQSALT
jgi:SRSO17 transposase